MKTLTKTAVMTLMISTYAHAYIQGPSMHVFAQAFREGITKFPWPDILIFFQVPGMAGMI